MGLLVAESSEWRLLLEMSLSNRTTKTIFVPYKSYINRTMSKIINATIVVTLACPITTIRSCDKKTGYDSLGMLKTSPLPDP